MKRRTLNRGLRSLEVLSDSGECSATKGFIVAFETFSLDCTCLNSIEIDKSNYNESNWIGHWVRNQGISIIVSLVGLFGGRSASFVCVHGLIACGFTVTNHNCNPQETSFATQICVLISPWETFGTQLNSKQTVPQVSVLEKYLFVCIFFVNTHHWMTWKMNIYLHHVVHRFSCACMLFIYVCWKLGAKNHLQRPDLILVTTKHSTSLCSTLSSLFIHYFILKSS